MISKRQHVEYLICTIGNFTSAHLAEHLDDVSYDVVADYLSNERLTARGLWELVTGLIKDGRDCPDETLTTQAAQEANDVRWQVEELHRGLKQLKVLNVIIYKQILYAR